MFFQIKLKIIFHLYFGRITQAFLFMRGPAAVLAVKLRVFHKFPYPVQVFPDYYLAQMVLNMTLLRRFTRVYGRFAHDPLHF